jgi:hypothetical protein
VRDQVSDPYILVVVADCVERLLVKSANSLLCVKHFDYDVPSCCATIAENIIIIVIIIISTITVAAAVSLTH